MPKSEITDVLSRLESVQETGDGWKARCPAHDDSNPSLSISEGDEQPVVLHCWAGCTSEDVVAALGLAFADICEGNGQPRDAADADTLSAVERERQKLNRRKANTNARIRRVERAKAKMVPAERLLFRLCCVTGHNCDEVAASKEEKRTELIERALNR